MRFYTTTDLPANLMARSFTANLMRIMPNGSAPLLALSGMAHTKRVKAVAHSYWIKRAIFPQFTTTGTHASGVTALNVTDTSNGKVGALLLAFNIAAGTFAAPELMRISAIASGTQFTVVRGVGGTTQQASLAAGTVLLEVGSMYEEGSAQPVARSITLGEHTNFTQIFRDTWDVTKTAEAVSLEPTMQLVSENKRDAAHFHALNIEWTSIFGRKGITTINGRPARTMDGIESIVLQQAPGNIVAAGNTTNFTQLETMLHPVLDYQVNGMSGTNRTLLCGAGAVEVINNIGRLTGYYELETDSTVFGMKFRRFHTSRGTWDILEHPLLNTNPTTRKMAIICDLADFDFMWLRETTHEDIAFNGTDAKSGVYTSELTLQIPNPLGWGIIYNLTAAA